MNLYYYFFVAAGSTGAAPMTIPGEAVLYGDAYRILRLFHIWPLCYFSITIISFQLLFPTTSFFEQLIFFLLSWRANYKTFYFNICNLGLPSFAGLFVCMFHLLFLRTLRHAISPLPILRVLITFHRQLLSINSMLRSSANLPMQWLKFSISWCCLIIQLHFVNF